VPPRAKRAGSIRADRRAKSKPDRTLTAGSRAATMRETRAALIDAGLALFAEHGLDVPSLDAICERAGFTRGAFYVHFATREEFLAAVMNHVGARVLDALLATEGAEGLDAVAHRFVDAIANGSYPLAPGGIVRFHQLLDACARVPTVREQYVGLIDESTRRIEKVLRADAERGRIRGDVDARTLAGILMAVVLGAQVQLELGVPMDIADTTRTMLRLLAGPVRSRAKKRR
jgi:AcrR family transcriptional regulator